VPDPRGAAAPPNVPALLANPLLLGLSLLAVSAGLLAIPPVVPRFFVVLGLLLLYIVLTTAFLIMLPHWWVRAFVALLTGLLLMFGMIAISEAYEEKSIGEASLAFLGPMMLHWIAIPATGLIQLAKRAASRRTPPA
jgi:hypothetical protein